MNEKGEESSKERERERVDNTGKGERERVDNTVERPVTVT